MERPDDETLMAYVDGVATPDQRAHVEQAIREAPEVRAHVEAMRRSATLLLEAFDRPIEEAPPKHLVDLILSAPDPASDSVAGTNNPGATAEVVEFRKPAAPGSHARPSMRPSMALAASIAMLLAAGAGFVAGTWRQTPAAPSVVALGIVPGGAIAGLLEGKPSGTTMPVAFDGSRRQMKLVNTFLDRNKRPCRELEVLAAAGGDARALVAAVACRTATGAWVVEGALRLASNGDPRAPGYEPSGMSEQDALDGLLNTLGAGAALSAADEAALLRGGWKQP